MDARHADAVMAGTLEQQIEAWRTHLRRSRAIAPADASELEDHLRETIGTLREDGLSEDEAFLVAVKRMGALDALTREFAREHSERLWKQLVLSDDRWDGAATSAAAGGSRRMWVALALAIAAGIAIKVPALFGVDFEDPGMFYPRNIAFFVLPFIVAYFAWDRPLARPVWLALLGVFGAAALLVNVYPFTPSPGSDTEVLTVIHLPIMLWLAVGIAYAGGAWRGSDRRMDFIRFTGEFFIYFVLIGLGGGVLIGMTVGLFEAIGIDVEPYIGNWIVPVGAAGATLVATWLVEAKQSVIENMAPVLTRVFTPLFTLALIAFLVTMLVTARGLNVEREILILFDLLLVVVFGLLLYSFSARDPLEPARLFDWLLLTLVLTALVVDALALWAVLARITGMGFTPNRVAALGFNLVLLANLVGSVTLYVRFLRGRGPFGRVLQWQMFYLYVLAGWAAFVAFVFPLLFRFA